MGRPRLLATLLLSTLALTRGAQSQELPEGLLERARSEDETAWRPALAELGERARAEDGAEPDADALEALVALSRDPEVVGRPVAVLELAEVLPEDRLIRHLEELLGILDAEHDALEREIGELPDLDTPPRDFGSMFVQTLENLGALQRIKAAQPRILACSRLHRALHEATLGIESPEVGPLLVELAERSSFGDARLALHRRQLALGTPDGLLGAARGVLAALEATDAAEAQRDLARKEKPRDPPDLGFGKVDPRKWKQSEKERIERLRDRAEQRLKDLGTFRRTLGNEVARAARARDLPKCPGGSTDAGTWRNWIEKIEDS